MTAKQFELELKAEWAAKIEDVHEFVSIVGLEALIAVVQKSPVDTGRFKGNWNLSIGSADNSTTQTVDTGGGATIARANTAISAYSQIDGFPAIVISNNLPYGPRLEGGYSGQAPNGMVALTIAEIQARFDGAQA